MSDLRQRWLDYLSYCNDRRLNELGDHVHDTIYFNDQLVTLTDYVAAIAGNIAVVPDFHWAVEDLVVDTDRQNVAVRLTDTGTPHDEWLDIAPVGASFRIAEWAVYHYRDNKIASMHFLLDTAAARAQLTPRRPLGHRPDPLSRLGSGMSIPIDTRGHTDATPPHTTNPNQDQTTSSSDHRNDDGDAGWGLHGPGKGHG